MQLTMQQARVRVFSLQLTQIIKKLMIILQNHHEIIILLIK
jgi:hypothetical protein